MNDETMTKEDIEYWDCFDAEIQILRLKAVRDEIHQDFLAGRVSRWVCGKALAGFNSQIGTLENMMARAKYDPFDLSFPPSVVVPVPVVKIEEKPKKKKRGKINQKDVNFDLFS